MYYTHSKPVTTKDGTRRATAAILLSHVDEFNKDVLRIGLAICSPSDQFSRKTGRSVASIRARTLPAITIALPEIPISKAVEIARYLARWAAINRRWRPSALTDELIWRNIGEILEESFNAIYPVVEELEPEDKPLTGVGATMSGIYTPAEMEVEFPESKFLDGIEEGS